MNDINFSEIEKKWQQRWKEKGSFVAVDGSKKEKYYVLEMFPYPSGSGLHMGHAWNYTIGDILARFKMMMGFNVLHPMGYDSLGLPAENAAIEAGQHPEDYTNKSIPNFIKQQQAIGLSYDWDRMISSHDPSYYKWDQWIFLKMLEKGLAYQKTSAVNWCRKCNTVLANEQVHDGKCWRHDDVEVEVKHLKQWFLKTTEYADELYDNLDNMNWPERTKAMQKNWIGKSHGTEIDFEVDGDKWPIFTTRPDTIFGVTFMVVSAQHTRLDELVTSEQRKDVDKFLKKIKGVSQKNMKDLEELDKEGVFTGSYAINPANGERVPIWAGNFVVADYGAGMVMAVPAHDQRDFDFAKKYGIEIRQVIDGEISDKRAFTDRGKLINSKEFSGIENKEAIKNITDWLIKEKTGRRVVNFKLRDWGISRQRYWGTPIPIIHCDKCGAVPVPEKDLPVELPKQVKFGKGNPLETNEEWLNVKCPKCGGNGRRESDTMDTFVNSSWYFLRYCDSKNDKEIFDSNKVKYWCPIDTYIGGAEHACMHLIYVRFYTKFLRDIGLLDFDEPAHRLFHQGMLRAEGGSKMSKSKPETCVLPEEVSDKYGIDTARFFLSSLASPDKDVDWSEKGINGSARFVKKIFAFIESWKECKDDEKTLVKLNKTIKNVSKYYENLDYRKATIELRELFDLIEKGSSKASVEKFLQMLNPICPHITEELWERIGNKGLICNSDWPKADSSKTSMGGGSGDDLNSKIIDIINSILEKVDGEKVYVYVMPFEIDKVDVKKIAKEVNKDVEVFSVSDSNKYDPQNKAKKARPGLASIYLE
jgi:leucyl-tRNA synthetase